MTAIFNNQQEQTPINTRPIPVASHHAGDQIITHKADTYSFKIDYSAFLHPTYLLR